MSIIQKKEKNLIQLISKLNSLTLTYSQPTYEIENIKTEKNEILINFPILTSWTVHLKYLNEVF